VKKKQEYSSISSKILQSFSINPKWESIGEILLPKLSRAMSWVAWWQEQEGGLKFQQSNSSSKNGSENEWGGVLLIPLEAKWRHLDECQVLVFERERVNLYEGGAPPRVLVMDCWVGRVWAMERWVNRLRRAHLVIEEGPHSHLSVLLRFWEQEGRELGKGAWGMREGRHMWKELECGVKVLVRWRFRRGAPLIRGAHTKN